MGVQHWSSKELYCNSIPGPLKSQLFLGFLSKNILSLGQDCVDLDKRLANVSLGEDSP